MKIVGKVDLTTWDFGYQVETLPWKERRAILAEVSKVIDAQLREPNEMGLCLGVPMSGHGVEVSIGIPLSADDTNSLVVTARLKELVDNALEYQGHDADELLQIASELEKQAKRLRKAASKRD